MPTVLYGDDEQEHRMMMQTIMVNHEIELLEAANGLEAIDQIKLHQPDLVLLDLYMPRIDGFGVLQAIKRDRETQHIPFIILSAWPTGDNRERARRFGAIDFIAKPYDPARLIQIVQKHLDAQSRSAATSTAKNDTDPLSFNN